MAHGVPELWLVQQEEVQGLYVAIELEETRLTREEGMLPRVEIEAHPILSRLRIVRLRSNTNYRVESELADVIDRLWKARRSGGAKAFD